MAKTTADPALSVTSVVVERVVAVIVLVPLVLVGLAGRPLALPPEIGRLAWRPGGAPGRGPRNHGAADAQPGSATVAGRIAFVRWAVASELYAQTDECFEAVAL